MQETVKIERMSYGPDGIGHLSSGKAVFVSGAVEGDIATVEIVEEKRSFARAVCVKVEEASRLRAKGGSSALESPVHPWSQLSYEAQLAAKQANVRHALMQAASLPESALDDVILPIVPCKQEWGYRNKMELAAAKDDAGRLSLGFHREGSQEIDVARTFPLGNRLIEKAPKALTGVIRYIAGDRDLGIYRVGVRGSVATKSIEVALWTPPSSFPRSFAAKALQDAVKATSVVRVIAEPGSARRVKNVEVLAGRGFWQENIVLGKTGMASSAGVSNGKPEAIRFDISAPSFFQVNTNQTSRLVSRVLDALKVEDGAYVADLYAGAGTFSIPLAKSGAEVVAVEIGGSSANDLRRNCGINGVDIDVICDDVARTLPNLEGLDAVVVDPPRAGLEGKVIDALAEASPEKIAYVSCDPQTLARDMGLFAAAGYDPVLVQAVDMFPQTYHVETYALMSRKRR